MLQVWIHIGHARDGRTIAGTGKSMWRHPPCLANWTRKWGLVSGQPPLPAFIFSPLSNVDIMINLPSNQYRLPQGYNQQDLESVSSFYE